MIFWGRYCPIAQWDDWKSARFSNRPGPQSRGRKSQHNHPFFLVTFNVAGLLLLWNLRSPSEEHSPATSCSLPPRRLACRSVPVCLTNHRREGGCRHSLSCKAFWNGGLETHLFWGIPTLRETKTRILRLWSVGRSGHFSQHVTSFSFQTSMLKIARKILWTIVSVLKTQYGLCVCLPLGRNSLWHAMWSQAAPGLTDAWGATDSLNLH